MNATFGLFQFVIINTLTRECLVIFVCIVGIGTSVSCFC